jgi:hypothetical protein
MAFVFRIALFLGFVGTLLGMVQLTEPGFLEPFARNVAQLCTEYQRVAHEQERSRTLNELRALTLARRARKDRVAMDLAAGRLTLVEAASRFRDLPAPALSAESELRYKEGMPVEQCWCRDVIGWMEVVLAGHPNEAAKVTARLEHELRNHLRRYGKVCLPAPAP